MKKNSSWLVISVALAAACGGEGDRAATAKAPISRATGELGAWTALEPMPQARNNFCAVVASGHLVAIGGNYKAASGEWVDLDAVHVARIAEDGTLGAWSLAGKTPAPVTSCTAASDGETVFLLDGIYKDPGSAPKVVLGAKLSDDGTLEEFQTAGTLPKGARVPYSSAWVEDKSLFAFSLKLPDQGDALALVHAPLESGSLGAGTETTWSAGFRGHPSYAATTTDGGKRFVYAIGGYAGPSRDNVVLADGVGAALDPSGAVGSSFAVSELPKPTAFGKAVGVDAWVFVVGGKDQIMTGSGQPDVLAARSGEAGELGPWQSLEPLPEGRLSHAVVAHGDWLYVLGGAGGSGPQPTVYAARVRSPGQ